MKKTFYEQPTTKILVVRFEGILCGSDPAKVYHIGGAGSYGDDDSNENGDY